MAKTDENKAPAPSKETEKFAAAADPKKLLSEDEEEIDYASYAGAGHENVTAADLAIPFLTILQANSPQVKKTDPGYIKGAEEGDFYNTLTKEIIKAADGVSIIPCSFIRVAIEWKLKEAGGGLVAIHPAETDLIELTKVDEKNRNILPNGNQLSMTAQHSVLYRAANSKDGEWHKAIIALASTQLKKSRRWLSQMGEVKKVGKNGMKFTPPSFALIFTAKPIVETKDKNTWWGWDIVAAGEVSEVKTFKEAAAFYDAISRAPKALTSNNSAKQLANAVGNNADSDLPM